MYVCSCQLMLYILPPQATDGGGARGGETGRQPLHALSTGGRRQDSLRHWLSRPGLSEQRLSARATEHPALARGCRRGGGSSAGPTSYRQRLPYDRGVAARTTNDASNGMTTPDAIISAETGRGVAARTTNDASDGVTTTDGGHNAPDTPCRRPRLKMLFGERSICSTTTTTTMTRLHGVLSRSMNYIYNYIVIQFHIFGGGCSLCLRELIWESKSHGFLVCFCATHHSPSCDPSLSHNRAMNTRC